LPGVPKVTVLVAAQPVAALKTSISAVIATRVKKV
jgi:hypothetical protein